MEVVCPRHSAGGVKMTTRPYNDVSPSSDEGSLWLFCIYYDKRTSQPVTYTQSHNTHLHYVYFISITSSPLTLTHIILRHNTRVRCEVTCTLLQKSAAAAAPAAVVSALQLTPEILAVHEVRFISSSTVSSDQIVPFFLAFQSRRKTSHRPACVKTGRPLEHEEILFKYLFS
jgi:hypothetical protein